MDTYCVVTMVSDYPLEKQKYWGVLFHTKDVAIIAAKEQHKELSAIHPSAYTQILNGDEEISNDDVVWLMIDEFVFENTEAGMVSNILGDLTGRFALAVILRQRKEIADLRRIIKKE